MNVKEGYFLKQMRRNVRKKVILSFKYYELRTKALIKTTDDKEFESILPAIKLSALRRRFIKDELKYELDKIKGCSEADLTIDILCVYGSSTVPSEYRRYLGGFTFLFTNLQPNEIPQLRHKTSKLYFQDPEKHTFIPDGL